MCLLVHDGSVILESSIIIDYLDDTFPDPPLKPKSPLSRARMREWMMRLDVEAHEALGILNFATTRRHQLMEKMSADELEKHIESIPHAHKRYWQREAIYKGIDAPIVKDAIECWNFILEDMESTLGSEEWLSGKNISLADIAITPYITRFSWLGMSELWEQNRPNVTDWVKRIRNRPSYAKAITNVIDRESIGALQKHGSNAWPTIKAMLDEA